MIVCDLFFVIIKSFHSMGSFCKVRIPRNAKGARGGFLASVITMTSPAEKKNLHYAVTVKCVQLT